MNLTIDLENELSLVIGKNNTGKTSILATLDKFIRHSGNNITSDDFNLDFKKEIQNIIVSGDEIIKDEYEKTLKAISLRLVIEYDKKDDLKNISQVMMDLNPENNFVIIGFDWLLEHDQYKKIRVGYAEFINNEQRKKKEAEDKKQPYQVKDFYYFFNRKQSEYFRSKRKSIEYNTEKKEINEEVFIDLDKEKISLKNIINFQFINARRDVTNKEPDKTLSGQTSKIFEKTETSDEQNKNIEEFKDVLADTDSILSDIYKDIFNSIITKISVFGGLKPNESLIDIVSTLQHKELLKGNTTVQYLHDENNKLPEHYNGLGYMNLISMIFEIEILMKEFSRSKDESPADINLLFIEEPEAHTHPQMQYVFINNIQNLLKEGIKREDGQNRSLQYIISTHSSHLVSNCKDFNAIKYLKKERINEVKAKNLVDLEKEYHIAGEEQNYRFLKQYLTLNRAELFFADKAVFIEGDTERILIPAMMKKIDQEYPDNPLLSQNISIVEVGAHAQIFEKFIDFIGLKKGLIITDIDSYYKETIDDGGVIKEEYVKCSACNAKATNTGNSALKFFHNANSDLNYYKNLAFDWKILRKNRKKIWNSNRKGNLLIVFQTKQNDYHARSFEDAFFSTNNSFFTDEEYSFNSLTKKWLVKYKNSEISHFDFAEKAVGSKPSLAIEILLNSKTSENDTEFSNWEIPAYIKEGLIWLKKD
jgi:predicted ATP-dependent endonuclease of OLD family